MVATIHSTLGMLFHSVVIGSALYGAGCLQGYLYFRRHKGKDGWILQSLVGFILLCDTFQMAILTACVYDYTITNQGNPAILATMFNTLIIEIFFSNAIALVVQMFYCWRIWLLSKRNWVIAGFLVVLSWSSFVLLFVYSVMALRYSTYMELAHLKNISMSCNILAAASDIFISLAMVFYLQTSKTGYRKSNNMINRLIIFTFNTGIPVSVCALFACISINVWSDTFIYMFFFLMQGRFYTNSILVTLNSREYIRDAGNSYSMSSYPARHALGGTANLTSGAGVEFHHPNQEDSVYEQKSANGGIAIRIDTTQTMDRDGSLKQGSTDHSETASAV